MKERKDERKIKKPKKNKKDERKKDERKIKKIKEGKGERRKNEL